MDKYPCFFKLASREERGVDYKICVRQKATSRVVIIAPHGGGIEPETSRIAENIAGAEFSLYCFMGRKSKGNSVLHITSHNFDEPECLKLIAEHNWVLAIHGCNKLGEIAFLGGLDKLLICDLASALHSANIPVETTGHPYPGKHKRNICNRGAQNAGAQFELSLPFRQGNQMPLFIKTVRDVLTRIQQYAP